MAAAVDYTSERRRRHLEALAREVRTRGLHGHMVGQEEPMLQVSDPATGRGTLVLAMQTSRIDWSYLWGGGGQAGVEDPARAADLIAEFLAGAEPE